MTFQEATEIHQHELNKGSWDSKYTIGQYDLALDIITGRKPASDDCNFRAPVYGSWFISDRD